MIEVTGDLWTYPADVRVITTNGTVRKDGACVMGRGCAHEARLKWQDLPTRLGTHIRDNGNVVGYFQMPDMICSFPVKHNWYEKADLELIKRSAEELVNMIDPLYPNDEGHVIVIPRPGCGNGQLKWEDVKPILESILDDRFHVITFK